MARHELDLKDTDKVVGGSYDLNHNNGKCAIGNADGAVCIQITANYDVVQAAFDEIMNGEGTDLEKNAAMLALFKEKKWGTVVKKTGIYSDWS